MTKILPYFKYFSILVMSIFYVNVGIKHFTDPLWFLHIIPPFLNSIGLELVYISGFFEIVFGMMLALKKNEKNSCLWINSSFNCCLSCKFIFSIL